MCWLQLFGLLSILPYFLLLLMPVYGSFYGKEPILRMSLFLMGQSILTSVTSRFVLLADPLIQLAMTILYLSMKTSIIPAPLVWLFDKVMFVSEPVWQLLEALGVVFLVMDISQEAADHADEQPSLAKGFILSVSGACYVLIMYLVWCIVNTEITFYIWAALFVLLVSVIIHIIVIRHESGILSDAAVVAACSMVMLYDVSQSTLLTTTHVQVPSSWTNFTSDHSYIQMMFKITVAGLENGSHTWQFFTHLWSPWFIMTAAARICCMLYAVGLARIILNKLAEWYEEDSPLEDRADFDDEDNDLPITLTLTRSPLLIRIVLIFVYTQFLICHVNIYHLNNSWLSWIQSWFPSGRWLQIVLLNGYFLYRLHTKDEDIW